MSYFAEIDSEGIVIRVLSVEQDFIDSGKLGDSKNWVQTSYNTHKGIHYAANAKLGKWYPDGGIALRKNYAAKGYTYDKVRDAFIPPQPSNQGVVRESWTLDEDTCVWEAPVPHPMDGKGPYMWDEDIVNWVKIDVRPENMRAKG